MRAGSEAPSGKPRALQVSPEPESQQPVRVLRVISRLMVGGPAIQATTLAAGLSDRGYETTLVHGRESANEGSMADLAESLAIKPTFIPELRRELGLHDIRAFVELVRVVRRVRPKILHTHLAKAGALARIAAFISGTRPPIVIHTFHGHVFTGVFTGGRAAAVKGRAALLLERGLARLTTELVAVSDEVRDDLLRLRVMPADRIRTIRLGFDLAPFQLGADERSQARRTLRDRLGIPQEARVVTAIARVVQMKRIDRFLRVAHRLAHISDAWFLIVGDGDQRESLERSEESRRLGERVVWAGIVRDIPAVCAASDVVLLTSDNEGTPVALIEAQAAGVPVVATDVGGVATVVQDGVTGRLLASSDEEGLAHAVNELLGDRALASCFVDAAQDHVLERFSLERLIDDIDHLYRDLLGAARCS